MPAPLVGAAALAAARLIAGKVAGKAAKKVIGKSVKKAAATKKQAAIREETKRIAKNSVKVKNPAKRKANKPDAAKLNYKAESSRGRAGDTAYRNFANDQTPRKADGSVDRFMRFTDEANLEAMIARQEAVLGRKTKIGIQKSMGIKPAKRPKKTAAVKKTLKKLKPMEDVPKGVSARFAETNARLAKQAAKKKK